MRIDGQRTRAKLVDTAEQLFAEQGIGNVTLLAVSKAAGQSNRNAAAYYFGNKRGLLEAVLRKHSAGINEERLRRLEELERKATLELADLMGAIVSPQISIEFAAPARGEWIGIDSRCHHCEGAIASGVATLWSADGTLVATVGQSALLRRIPG